MCGVPMLSILFLCWFGPSCRHCECRESRQKRSMSQWAFSRRRQCQRECDRIGGRRTAFHGGVMKFHSGQAQRFLFFVTAAILALGQETVVPVGTTIVR